MKNRILTKGIFILLVVIGMSCQGQSSKWKGTIEEHNGVTNIKNPKNPTNEDGILNFEEELTIGQENGKPEYSFSRIGGIDVDEKGKIYVIDQSDANVRVFDSRGTYLRTIGRKGQGPGEMQYPVFVQITPRQEVLIYDYMVSRMLYFSPDGPYLSQKTTRQPILPIKLDSRGNLIGQVVLAPPPMGGKEIYKYDPEFKSFTEIAKEDMGAREVFDIGKPSCYCAVTPSDMIIWGNSEEYILYVLNPQGKLVKQIIGEYEPQAITTEDKDAFKKTYAEPLKAGMKINFRNHFPAFSNICVDDEERIFVKTYEHATGREGAFFYDVYSRDGIFMAKMPMKIDLNRNLVWKKGKLYTIESDENGVQLIKRYRATWKNIKGAP
jgi:hypothetical protein